MTYTLGLARSHVVRQASDVVRVAHENGRLDGLERGAGQRRAGTAAQSVVHDLPALAVSDEHYLCLRAARVELCDGTHDGGRTLGGAVFV